MGPLRGDREVVVTILVPLGRLCSDSDTWPRDGLDQGRVDLFATLLEDGESLPPIEVVGGGDGSYLICDGMHRSHAAHRLGRIEIEAIVIDPRPGESAVECAFRRALETATRSALPLTRAERRRAALRLLSTRQDLSRRAVAKLVGVAHSTVDRWAEEGAEVANATEADGASTRSAPTADQVARRLVSFLCRLDESRGLLDHLAPARIGKHLAAAFSERFGDDGPKQADRLAEWASAAARLLRES